MKGGGGKGGGSTTTQDRTNFLDFQRPAINRVFDILGGGAGEDILLGGTGRDSLLQVPGQASRPLGQGLDFLSELFRGDDPSTQGLLNFQSLINEDIGQERFNDVTDRFETIGNRAEGAFAPFIQAALGLGQQGANPEFRNILAGFANEDPFSNPFVNQIVENALTDQEAARIDAAVQSGGLGGPGQSQIAQREAGRLSADIRGRFGESSRNRALQAAGQGAQFDLSNAAQRLNALIGGGNLTSQRFGTELGAAQGVLGSTQAEVARRNQLLGLRGQNEAQLAGLPFQGLSAVGPLANTFTELPFVPLSNFAALAQAPLGGTTTQETEEETGFLDTIGQIAGLGLTGASLFGGTPLTGFTSAASGVPGFGPFGTGLGPLATGLAPPPPIFR